MCKLAKKWQLDRGHLRKPNWKQCRQVKQKNADQLKSILNHVITIEQIRNLLQN